MAESNSITKRKPGPKPKAKAKTNPQRDAVVEKLFNIAQQNITHYLHVASGAQLNGKVIMMGGEIKKSSPKEFLDCIKSVHHNDGGYTRIDLHDPLKAVELLIQLGEL